jgi:hypothetical protein
MVSTDQRMHGPSSPCTRHHGNRGIDVSALVSMSGLRTLTRGGSDSCGIDHEKFDQQQSGHVLRFLGVRMDDLSDGQAHPGGAPPLLCSGTMAGLLRRCSLHDLRLATPLRKEAWLNRVRD